MDYRIQNTKNHYNTNGMYLRMFKCQPAGLTMKKYHILTDVVICIINNQMFLSDVL